MGAAELDALVPLVPLVEFNMVPLSAVPLVWLNRVILRAKAAAEVTKAAAEIGTSVGESGGGRIRANVSSGAVIGASVGESGGGGIRANVGSGAVVGASVGDSGGVIRANEDGAAVKVRRRATDVVKRARRAFVNPTGDEGDGIGDAETVAVTLGDADDCIDEGTEALNEGTAEALDEGTTEAADEGTETLDEGKTEAAGEGTVEALDEGTKEAVEEGTAGVVDGIDDAGAETEGG